MRLGELEEFAAPPSTTSLLDCVQVAPRRQTLQSSASVSHTRKLITFRLILPILLLAPGLAQAQTAPPPSSDIQREPVEQLQELLRTKKDLRPRNKPCSSNLPNSTQGSRHWKRAWGLLGQYGDPWDFAAGLTYFPFGHKEVRINGQALYTDASAVGYTAIPYQVGGTGWIFTLDVGTWF